MIEVRVQSAAFDVGAEHARLAALGNDVGAVASFVGHVRADNGGRGLTLEHYPGMTEAQMRAVADEAVARWPLAGVTIVHRTGTLAVGEPIVLVLAAARHRGDALEACAFLIDWLKTRATFWKREETDGRARWVEARDSDTAAAARWQQQS